MVNCMFYKSKYSKFHCKFRFKQDDRTIVPLCKLSVGFRYENRERSSAHLLGRDRCQQHGRLVRCPRCLPAIYYLPNRSLSLVRRPMDSHKHELINSTESMNFGPRIILSIRWLPKRSTTRNYYLCMYVCTYVNENMDVH